MAAMGLLCCSPWGRWHTSPRPWSKHPALVHKSGLLWDSTWVLGILSQYSQVQRHVQRFRRTTKVLGGQRYYRVIPLSSTWWDLAVSSGTSVCRSCISETIVSPIKERMEKWRINSNINWVTHLLHQPGLRLLARKPCVLHRLQLCKSAVFAHFSV